MKPNATKNIPMVWFIAVTITGALLIDYLITAYPVISAMFLPLYIVAWLAFLFTGVFLIRKHLT